MFEASWRPTGEQEKMEEGGGGGVGVRVGGSAFMETKRAQGFKGG